LAVSNIATLGHQIYQRMSALGRFIPQDCQSLVADLEDQFDRVAGVADGQVRYLEGVIEFYKARTDTKVTIAAERLALIAVLTLPITALSSVYGMNIIVNDRTNFAHLAVVLAAMVAISAVLLRWGQATGMVVAASQSCGRQGSRNASVTWLPRALCQRPEGRAVRVGHAEHAVRYLERRWWTAPGELMRRALAGLMRQRSGIIVGAECR
jgi:putative hemolysin